MNWFFIALVSPALWSVTNHLDKYLISKYIKGGGIGALMVFSSLIGLFLIPLIYAFFPDVIKIDPLQAVLICGNAFLYLFAVLPYFYALQKDEASIVVPMFQLVPVMSYGLSYAILGETLSNFQIIGGLLVVLGAIGISFELAEGKTVKFKSDVFLLMALSSFFYSLNFILFKYFALELDFWTVSFWEYVGFVIFAILILLFIKNYRNEFLSLMKENKIPVLGLNGFNEIVNIIAKLSFNFASTLAPVTMVWIVNGTQPFFVFLYGIILTIFFPHISQERLSRKHLIQKIVAITIMFAGASFLK